MVEWFDQAAAEPGQTGQTARIGLCDLAAHDLAAISAHYVNEIAIVGRYGTLFRSAFDLPAKVDPADILAVEGVVGSFGRPEQVIDLRSLIPN